ncbi:MAG: hypothetical protein P8N43_11155 [Alphaproteobacteria bacterium]|nr:hypothetical protein [Alphaproteobacteria bacterium]
MLPRGDAVLTPDQVKADQPLASRALPRGDVTIKWLCRDGNQNRSLGVRLTQIELDVLIVLADGHRFGEIPRLLPDQPAEAQAKAIKRMAHMLHAVGAAFIGSTD